jgi:MinD-like ATPase involved in chromosome partitioning or flagellar assembly
LAASDQIPRTILVLTEGSQASAAGAALQRAAPPGSIEFLVPPLRGSRFLTATGSAAAELDAWWQASGRAGRRPVVLLSHEDGLPELLSGLDAEFLVAVPDQQTLGSYAGLHDVLALVTPEPWRLAEVALERYGFGSSLAGPPPPDPFHLLAGAGPLAAPAEPSPRPLTRGAVLGPSTGSPSRRRRSPHGAISLGQFFDRLSQLRRPVLGHQLGQAILARKPLLAAVVSRKGGVGKTASAAAVAALLGEAVDEFGHTAALVDANIGNPDAWGRLDVRGQAITVREIVGRLTRGEEPPSPAYAETPALAVYPESREAGDGYAPAQVQRLAGYLKARHAAVVVDLPNRLPSFSSPDAALAAAWIAEAAVVVVPTTADPAALLGVTEYMSAPSLSGKPVVVPYIVPRLRQIRTAPEIRELLERIRSAGATVVEVPDDDRATLALIRRTAITEAGLALRQAYVTLATRVVEAAAVQPTAEA